jgi:hypothetical protein
MNGRDEARKYPEDLSEKKPGLFLVKNHSFEGTVWLDCRVEGVPELYAYSNDGRTDTVRDTAVTKKVKGSVRSNQHVQLGSFTEVQQQ